ncbi:hypothetical protein TNCV_1571211 [Trichonephila clavipes]|uniref:Uncharacterized protein n=1 Tax=Trichonephila clavipes TaxID=2585209 RepID=A0A8X6SPG1_TRICX|nr:hypothetical protein TNCV_1571211 [Trichonephila clavipes]
MVTTQLLFVITNRFNYKKKKKLSRNSYQHDIGTQRAVTGSLRKVQWPHVARGSQIEAEFTPRLSASSVKRLANQRLHLGRNEVSDWLDARHSTFVRLGVNEP